MFNFRRLPKAAVLAILVILILECSSRLLLEIVKHNCVGGDLQRMDSDFFCRNFKKYAQDRSFDQKYPRKLYKSIEDMSKNAPYDVIVFGSSVANTGWVEILKQDFGIKICSTALSGAEVINNYSKINDHRKSLLLYADITERNSLNLNMFEGIEIFPNENTFFSLSKMIKYIYEWIKVLVRPKVKIININGAEELFYVPDLKGLSMKVKDDSGAYFKLVQQLKSYKDSAARENCLFAIITFPTKPQQYEWLLLETGNIKNVSPRANLRILKKAAAENKIPFLDIEERLTPIAKEVYAKEKVLLWYRDDTHMNGLGVRYAADIIKDFIDNIDKP